MDGLNHLWEQSTDAFIDKTLEEMYSLLIIQVQPEFLLKLADALDISIFIGREVRDI
uniref:Uncharacterized protein n=1 Tax=Arundo donax TaxID=35708 RepID=A0A0A8ZT59_ARUDO